MYVADCAPTGELAIEIGGVAVELDVASAADMERLAEAASGASVVCLNAGIVGPTTGHPWEVPTAEWERVLAVNVGGVVNGLRAFVPRLLASGEPAQVLITASLAGLLTFPGGGAYAASKHAVLAVAEQAALVLDETNVSVTVVCPALVRSGMSEVGADPADVAAEALTAARAGRFLVAPDEWADALRARTETLLAGRRPEVPAPEPVPESAAHAEPGRVRQMRLVVDTADYDAALAFYRNRLGAPVELQLHGETGEKVTILDVGRATLELSNPAQVEMIDRVEVGRRVAPRLRVAFEVDDVDRVTEELVEAGAELVAAPTRTPWDSLNARLEAPAGLQLTLFEELGSAEER